VETTCCLQGSWGRSERAQRGAATVPFESAHLTLQGQHPRCTNHRREAREGHCWLANCPTRKLACRFTGAASHLNVAEQLARLQLTIAPLLASGAAYKRG